MFNVLRRDFVFLVSSASTCMFVLCFDIGCFGFLLLVLQPSVVGDPFLSFKHNKQGSISYMSEYLLVEQLSLYTSMPVY